MKKIISLQILILIGFCVLPLLSLKAGNEDRTGQAGASELLINPWARSSGLAGANVANVRGLEGQYLNVAGLAFTKRTELMFTRTNWLSGSDVIINAFGFSQKLGEEGGVLGFGIMSMSFGDIDITTVDLPEGGIGKFSPSLLNINLSYAKIFSNSIYGGLNLKIIDERISDVSASGIALDAGIQYVTGKREQIKFGIALKNVGPTLRFKGDGLSFRGFIPNNPNSMTVEHRSASYELPSLIKIGFSYDFQLAKDHKLTTAGAFTSNSFIKDEYSLGLEYNWQNILLLRGGYAYEEDIFSDYDAGRSSAHTGPTAGVSVQAPINKDKGSTLSFDYSYRASNPFSGTHSFGVRLNL